jgi:nicotinamide-nucleotide amidase
MAEGARRSSGADYALATTGIAGPGGGTAEKPVGLVWIALAGPDGTETARPVLPGDRSRVRLRAAMTALNLLRLRLLRQ